LKDGNITMKQKRLLFVEIMKVPRLIIGACMEGKTVALVVMVFAFDLVTWELSGDHAWTQENLGRWKLKVST
jgi:hypothetical protein